MLKKLRRKIILMNMLMVGFVLVCVFAVLCVNSYRSASQDAQRSLRMAVEIGGAEQLGPIGNVGKNGGEDAAGGGAGAGGGNGAGGGQHSFTPNVTVLADDSGSVTEKSENGAVIDDDVLAQAVKAVLASDSESGTLQSLGLMYMKKSVSGGTRIAFAGTSTILTQLRKNVLVSLVVCAGAMGVLLLISLWLSGTAVKPVETAWKQQKQFVADASHELKTPLTVILANNDILMAHGKDNVEDQRKWLESTDEEAKRMKKLIDQMLALAKTDAPETHAVMGEVALSDLAEQQLLCFEPVAYERAVELSGSVEPGIRVVSDASMLRQIMQILLDNAVKYSPRGGTVTAKLVRRGNGAEFSVNNGGDPISPEDQEHIFDRFYRTDKARSGEGAGLGLAIVKGLTDLLGGKLAVASTAQEGTTFTLTL